MENVLIYLVFVAATVMPLMKLLPHFDIPKYWAFTAVLPVFIVILLWIMAMKLQERERGTG